MRNFNKKFLIEYLETWSLKEKKLLILSSSAFYLSLICFFLVELIHFDYSLGLQKGFEGMGGINFLKSDLFFLIFTISIIFFEFNLNILYYTIKGPIKRISNEKSIEDLFIRHNKSCRFQKEILFFFNIISIIYIFDNYIKIFVQISNQFIIIELFLHFILCLILGILFFSLIMVTLDTKILKNKIHLEKSNNNCLKVKKSKEILQIMTFFVLTLIIGNLLVIFIKII